MRCLLLFAVSAWLSVVAVFGEGHYSIIAPGTLHGDHKYSVAIGVHDVDVPCKLKVGITGPNYNDFKTLDLKSNELTTIDFDIPALNKEQTYNLTAEGISGLVFKNTTKLNYNVFNPYVKLQTDKGKYKPGDIVNFRVLFLDENLRPSTLPKDSYVFIEDEKRNRIKEYKDIKLVKGVYTGVFELSEFALLGTWRIVVKNGDSYYNPQVFFNVEKYVLPKYVVKVEATGDVSVRDGDMQVVVRANYTYGKPVNAKVTLVLKMNDYYYYGEKEKEKERKPAPLTIKTADMVNGKAKFDLNVKEYAEYMPHDRIVYSVDVTATVEEQFTGVQINGSTYSNFYPYRYKIECVDWSVCSIYYLNKENVLPIKILHVDNSKIDDTKSVVKLHFTEILKKREWYHSEKEDSETTTAVPPVITGKNFTFEGHLNETSIAVIKVLLDDLPEYEGYDHYYQVNAEFIDETHQLYSMNQYREPKNVQPEETEAEKPPTDWFILDTHYKKDKWSTEIGEKTTVSINCSVPMSYFVYHITGRGNVLHTERVELPEPTKNYNLTVTPTFMMAPYSSIYVYFVDNKGEFRYGETTVQADVALQNQIEVSAPEEVKPGSDTALKIKTQPHSFVGLLAVDQSVLLLGSNNDLSPDDFRWRLSGYSTSTPWQGGYSEYPGQRSGLITFTNADYFYNWTKPEWMAAHGAHAEVQRKAFHSTPLSGGAVVQDEVGSGQAAGDSGSNIRVRKDFSETWLFTDIEDTQTEEFTIMKQIPDTITSWVITAFSVNEDKGLGVVQDSTKVRTFQPFFISLRLPYAVKRGEVINIPALVFNYLQKDLDVTITLDNSLGEYEFVEANNEVIDEPKREKSVRVPANSARGVSFMIRPKAIGNIMLKYTAISPIAGDAVHKTLKVVPEGVTEYANRAYFVNLKDVPEFKETFELALPTDVVPDSEHIEFGVVGDLLGPVLNNLENLLRMPLGCGEQVTSTMIPNYMILRYLNKTQQLRPFLERQIIRNLETGYQHVLYYKNDDGSFSSFGWLRKLEKRNGSTWLTAYVTRTLNQITPYVEVDEKIIKQGLEFLSKQQAENGSFIEYGDYFYSSQNGRVSRTASVLLTFLENDAYKSIYQTVIDKALKYIVENVGQTKSTQTEALVAYVLHQAKHTAAHDRIASLKAKAKSDEDRMWWSDVDRNDQKWWRWVYSNDVETTSYILLVLLDLETEDTQSILPIIKWLIGQRNSYGGFSSTHDTVVGLQALIKFIEKSGYEAARMTIDFSAKGSEKKDTIKVTEDNALLLQTVELSPKTQGVDFHATGTGAALVQVAYQYNILEKEKTPSFTINTMINRQTPPNKLEMDVCVEYTGEGEGSNMAVLEVSLPSGYVADVESFDEIEKVNGVRLTETKNKESVVVVYFDSLHTKVRSCVPIIAYRQFPVAMQKPASVVVYDYYDTSRKATEYYEISSKICEICEEDEECKKKCQ